MKRRKGQWVLLLGLCLAVGTANAALLEDNFDSYALGAWPTAGDTWVNEDGGDFTITDSQSISGKSVKMESWSRKIMHEFDRQTSGVVTATAYIRPGNNAYRGVTFCLADEWDDSRATYVTFQSNGKIQYYPDGGTWTDVVSYGSYTWVKLTLEVDLDTHTYDIYTDDILRVSDAGFNKPGVAGIDKIYLDLNGPAFCWVDNVSITPEPATLSLLTLGGLGVWLRKK